MALQRFQLRPPLALQLSFLFVLRHKVTLEIVGVAKQLTKVVPAGLGLGKVAISDGTGHPIAVDQLPIDLKRTIVESGEEVERTPRCGSVPPSWPSRSRRLIEPLFLKRDSFEPKILDEHFRLPNELLVPATDFLLNCLDAMSKTHELLPPLHSISLDIRPSSTAMEAASTFSGFATRSSGSRSSREFVTTAIMLRIRQHCRENAQFSIE